MIRSLIPILLLLPLAGCVTQLTKASKRGDVERVRQLLKDGADPSKGMNVEYFPLWQAVENGHAEVVRLLVKGGADTKRRLFQAAHDGRIEIVRLLLDLGVDVNDQGHIHNLTALSGAGLGGHTAVARLLMQRGADLNSALFALQTRHVSLRNSNNETIRGFAAKALVAKGFLERLFTAPSAAIAPVAAAPSRPAGPTSDVDSPHYKRPERPDDFAIVIGIDGYKDLPSAQFAERDAKAVAAHVRALGVPRRHIIHLSGSDASYSSIKKYLNSWLPRNVKPTSRVFFYFSGHGAPDVDTGEAYLVPWDGDAAFLEDTAYPIKRLYSSLDKLKAKEVIVTLDACFSGAGGRSVLAKGARPLVTKVNIGKTTSGRISILTAASANQITTTLEEEGHGMFTYYFLKGLNGAAKDTEGRITAKSLYRYLKPKVQDEARLQNREQTPTVQYKTNVVLRSR